jgi:hypothetical protein
MGRFSGESYWPDPFVAHALETVDGRTEIPSACMENVAKDRLVGS